MCLLIEETRKKNPIEACGVLFGDINGKTAIVRKIAIITNTLASSTNFQVHPEEFVKALLEAEKNGMQLIGFFHSHPMASHPSPRDIKYMKLWPKTVWVIISSIDYSVKAYQNVNNKIQKITIEVSNKT